MLSELIHLDNAHFERYLYTVLNFIIKIFENKKYLFLTLFMKHALSKFRLKQSFRHDVPLFIAGFRINAFENALISAVFAKSIYERRG